MSRAGSDVSNVAFSFWHLRRWLTSPSHRMFPGPVDQGVAGKEERRREGCRTRRAWFGEWCFARMRGRRRLECGTELPEHPLSPDASPSRRRERGRWR